ncbi:hypothetical protein GGF42_005482 [Coemansia sp. RSA 2424]|nr:hypothetical protein GGF42_005482 [Coemansia sp. RSA 2424]
MTTLSAFQLLPEHVVKLIVDHVADSSRLQYDEVYNRPADCNNLHAPLLSVCHNFRAFVLARLYRRQLLDIYGFKKYPGPTVYSHHMYHLARELDVSLGLWSIYTGQALRLLSNAPYEGCAFPLVRMISIDIAADNYDSNDNRPGDVDDYLMDKYKTYPPDTATNIAAFVLRLKEMMPAISEVDMSHSKVVGVMLERRDAHLMDVAQRLFNIVETPTVLRYTRSRFTRYLDLEPVCSLVRLDWCELDGQGVFWPLIHRSALTLQMLWLRVRDMPDISGLIRDPDSGRCVEYSRLKNLRIDMLCDSAISRKLVFSGAVPFPRLRRLYIDQGCPFDDDVLFRGNSSSLESFGVALLPATVTLLQRYNVFTPTSHPKLQYVYIQPSLQDTLAKFPSATAYMQFLLSIAPESSVRRIYGLSEFDGALQPALALLGNHAAIQVLSIPSVWLSIWDAFDLIKSLPLLSDLHTAAPTLGKLPQGINMTDLPEYVRTTYAPMGVRFRCWNIGCDYTGCDEFDNHQNTATCVLLLALVCPSFDYAAEDICSHRPFMKAMREKIAEQGFSKYAPRLQRLLFDRWTGRDVDSDSDSDSNSDSNSDSDTSRVDICQWE